MTVIGQIFFLFLAFLHCVLAVEYPFEAGALTKHSHKVSGKVTILDEKRIQISDFVYDGKGPKTFFHVGTDHPITSLKQNLNNGNQILYENTCMNNGTHYNCGTDSGYPKIPRLGLKGVPKGHYIVTLPGDLTFPDIKWLSLYCRRFRLNFGDIVLNEVTVPEPVCKNKAGNKICNKRRRQCKKNKKVKNNCNLSCGVCCGNMQKDSVCEANQDKCYTRQMKTFCRKTCNICTV